MYGGTLFDCDCTREFDTTVREGAHPPTGKGKADVCEALNCDELTAFCCWMRHQILAAYEDYKSLDIVKRVKEMASMIRE